MSLPWSHIIYLIHLCSNFNPNLEVMARSKSPHDEEAGNSNERTSLLAASDSLDNGTVESAVIDDEMNIDPNEFDILLSKSESISGGIGIEPESQETAMLRGSRKYSTVKPNSRRSSRARQRSFVSTASDQEAISEGSEEEDEDDSKSPFMGVSVARFWLVFGGVLANNFVACFDGTIMVSSHPVITSYFNSANSASWLSTAFLLTSTSFQPLFGRLSDTIGRKTPYIFTLSIFLLSTIWCALAQSMTSFIAARALCGLGAGGAMSLGAIITSDLVPIEIRGQYQSYINIVFGVGSALGAALGGAIADHLGWRWEFGIQIPAILLCLVGAYITVPSRLGLLDGAHQKTLWQAMKVFDYRGSIFLTTSVTFLILGLVSHAAMSQNHSKYMTESRRKCPLVVPPLHHRVLNNLHPLCATLRLHRSARRPPHHATPPTSPQPTSRSDPRQLNRRHNHVSSDVQRAIILPSRAPRISH